MLDARALAQSQPALEQMAPACSFINGERVTGGEEIAIYNPARLTERVGTAFSAPVAHANAAIEASVSAARSWAETPLETRIGLLERAAEAVSREHPQESLATLLTREQGKILRESRIETQPLAGLVSRFAGLTRSALSEEILQDERGRFRTSYVPIGPVVVVTPWNWPVSLSMLKVIPALLAGNTVTLKPAPTTPLTVSRIVETFANRLPAGVLNLLNGGPEVGAALTNHRAVRKVVFTGSTRTGRRVFAACAESIKKMTLELGGNDAAILLDDVKLDVEMLTTLLRSVFVSSGQVCWAIKRLYAPSARYEEVQDTLAAAVNRLVVGDGLDPSVTLGPLNNAAQLAVVRNMVSEARALDARIIECGSVAAGTDWDNGYFHRPMIVSNLPDSAILVREEQFGPVLPVMKYDRLEEAVERANATEYGLCASIWTSDVDRGFDVARSLVAGQVFVNCHAGAAIDYMHAFGGVKQSGFGRELGIPGIHEYTEFRVYSNRIAR